MPPPPSSSVTSPSSPARPSTLTQSTISARLAEVTADVERLRVQATELHRILSEAQDIGLGRLSLRVSRLRCSLALNIQDTPPVVTPSRPPSQNPRPSGPQVLDVTSRVNAPTRTISVSSRVASRLASSSTPNMDSSAHDLVFNPGSEPVGGWPTLDEEQAGDFLRLLNQMRPEHNEVGSSSYPGVGPIGTPPSDPWVSTSSYHDFADLRRRHQELEAEVEQLRQITSLPFRRSARVGQGGLPNRVIDNRSKSPVLGQTRDSHRSRFPDAPHRRGLVPTNMIHQRSRTPVRIQSIPSPLPPSAGPSLTVPPTTAPPSTSGITPVMRHTVPSPAPVSTRPDWPPYVYFPDDHTENSHEPQDQEFYASSAASSDTMILEAVVIDPSVVPDDLDERAYAESLLPAARPGRPTLQAPSSPADHIFFNMPVAAPHEAQTAQNRRSIVSLERNESAHSSARLVDAAAVLAQATILEGQTLRELARAVTDNGPRSSPRSGIQAASTNLSSSARPASSISAVPTSNELPTSSSRGHRYAPRAANLSPSSGSASVSADIAASATRNPPRATQATSPSISRPELDSRLQQSRERIRELARLQSDLRAVRRGPGTDSRVSGARTRGGRGEVDLVEMINAASRQVTPTPTTLQSDIATTLPPHPIDDLLDQTPRAPRRHAGPQQSSLADPRTGEAPSRSAEPGQEGEASKDEGESTLVTLLADGQTSVDL